MGNVCAIQNAVRMSTAKERQLPMIRTIIIDDDPSVIERLSDAFRGAGDIAVTKTAGTATDGQAMILAGNYDVLLCDLGLPDGDGIDLIRLAAQHQPSSNTVVITIFADQAKVLDSIRAGASGYLLKDRSLLACVDAVRQVHAGGSPISPIIARQLLKRLKPADPEHTPLSDPLTPREDQVLHLLSRGFSYIEIGEILGVTRETIATYVKNIYRKLEVNSRAEAVFEANSRGLLDMH